MLLEVTTHSTNPRIRVCGDVTADADFSQVLGVSAQRLTFDMGSVRRFNSGGVHRWLTLVSALRQKGCELRFVNVTDSFLNQWAMIPGFGGNGCIDSLVLSYRCPRCEATHTRTFERGRDYEDLRAIPTAGPACPVCTAPQTDLDLVLDNIDG